MSLKHLTFLQADIAENTVRLWNWWRAELLALVPTRLRRILEAPPRHLTAAMAGAEWEIHAETKHAKYADQPVPLKRGTWQEVESALRKEKDRWGPLLTMSIRVPASTCLDRVKDLPAPALKRARPLLLLDLEQSTPFKRDDVYWDWYQSQSPSPGIAIIRQLILKRSRIAEVVDRLTALRVHVAAVEVEENGSKLPVNLWPHERQRTSLEVGLRRAAFASVLSSLLLAAFVAGLAIHRQQQALAALEIEKTALAGKASAVRKKLSQIEKTQSQLFQVRLRKAQVPGIVPVWEELTRRLPTTAWITDFKIDADTVVIDTLGQSGSELIQELAKSPRFKDVAFASPVTRDTQRNLERFQIRMRIQPITVAKAQ